MRRITLWALSTVSALVLLFSYRTSTAGPGGGTVATTGRDADDAPGPAADRPEAAVEPGRSAGSGGFDGTVAWTRWGPVQVRITVAAGRITDVTALRVPDDNPRDRQINAYAVPLLRQQALRRQSAELDGVSGATVTSAGYRESLQAAIDAAHLR
jgi:uncharacterized protein with FMN-binding domain